MGDPRASLLLTTRKTRKLCRVGKRDPTRAYVGVKKCNEIWSHFGLRESKNVTKDLFVRRPLNVNPRHVYVGQRSTLKPHITYSSGRPESIVNGYQLQSADGLSSP